MRKATILAALLLVTPVISQAKTLEELLVEKGVITKSEAGSMSDAGSSKVYWNRGTRIEFPDTGFTTNIRTQLQPRYTFNDVDQDTQGGSNTSGFTVRRARILVTGTALNNEFSYRFETQVAGDAINGASRSPELLDAWLQWNPCDENSGIRFGQMKPMISRQWVTHSSTLQFVERSLVSSYFDLDRQMGAMAFGQFADGAIQATAAIFNGRSDGEGRNLAPVDTKHTGVASVRWNALGKMDAYSEADVDNTQDAALSVGAVYAYEDGNQNLGSGIDNVDAHNFNADVTFKSMGFSFATEFFVKSARPDITAKSEALGFYAQAGYFLVPSKWEIAARYGYLDCDDGKAGSIDDVACAGNEDINEVSATVNYYFWKHFLKAQLGWDYMNYSPMGGGDDTNNNRIIFQLSSFF